jgi:hypothetical protein
VWHSWKDKGQLIGASFARKAVLGPKMGYYEELGKQLCLCREIAPKNFMRTSNIIVFS